MKEILSQIAVCNHEQRKSKILSFLQKINAPIKEIPFKETLFNIDDDLINELLAEGIEFSEIEYFENQINCEDYDKFENKGTNYEIDLSQYCRANSKNNKPIFLTAHHDIFPGSNGANDNASSISILLKLADYIIKNGSNIPITIVFFDKEETGGIGSKKYTENIDGKADFINLDACGYGNTIVFCDRYVDWNSNLYKLFCNKEIQDKYNIQTAKRFPFSDATIISENSHNVLSISVFPETYISSGNISFKIMESMHLGPFDDIKYINYDSMNSIFNLLVDILC